MAEKQERQYAPDEVNDHGEYIKIGGSPVPGITLRQVLRGHTGTIARIAWSPNGRYLASPSDDTTIRVWEVDSGKCIAVLEGHKKPVCCVAWSPDGQKLASGSEDQTSKIWDTKSWKLLREIAEDGTIFSVIWSPMGDLLASASQSSYINLYNTDRWNLAKRIKDSDQSRNILWLPNQDTIVSAPWTHDLQIWDVSSARSLKTLIGHKDLVYSVAASPDGKIIASGAIDHTVRLWNPETGNEITKLEGFISSVCSISFSWDGKLLATKEMNKLWIWRCKSWEPLVSITENTVNRWIPSVAFSTTSSTLASLGEHGLVLRIWDIDNRFLLEEQPSIESIRYTTAKLVLVGDSGVGKTGLGWRLAHNEFKEHSSTHGQQFWVVPELKKTREDGTECEAVLWDLAGQHIYRSIHSIFLDDVDASLVLFDPTNRQEPLKGAQFWLEQLKGKKQLPPSVLVGARLDRGAPVLSQQELDQFCQKYGISGGYIGTSAKSGEGLDKLVETLQNQIRWDQMTTTVTTVTFKRIKEFVLSLKEKPDRKGVLVKPDELRSQLEGTDKDWNFTDAEMMTAVGHLANHGYVTILKSSSGEEFILLVPELLASVAASIVLLADKNPRELGAVSETELLQGTYQFEEFKGLDQSEQKILLDASVLKFLEHSICFRETLGRDTLLIFPGLIKQKRPLQDEFESVDDVSYSIRGRVENIYASLVVLLGYTSTFTRINQWQNQAQYEMGIDEICGFRLIEEREGELELVLYYSTVMPNYGRSMFQGLFEKFLNQRDVNFTRFPPVSCSNNHLQQRATVMNMIHDGEKSMFCAKCGREIILPELDKPVAIGARVLEEVDQENALARLRNTYETYLARVKSFRSDRNAPRCYVSYADEQLKWTEGLIRDLRDAGVLVLEDREQTQRDDFVLIVGTQDYPEALEKSDERIVADAPLIGPRIPRTAIQKSMLVPLLVEGNAFTAFPREVRGCMPGDFRIDSQYVVSLFDLILTLYAIPFDQSAFEPLRKNLLSQWEDTLNRKKELPQQGVYISYAWGGESEITVNELDKTFQEQGVTIIRDKRDLGYKGRIKAFMETIGKGKAVILVISEKYLKSENCMFELLQVAKNGEFEDRIFPIVLDDAKIYAPVDRIRYVTHWEQKITELDEAIRSVGAANLHGFRDDIDLYTEIRAHLPRLAEILKDMNTLSAKIHRDTGYGQLFNDVVAQLEK